MKCVVNYNNFFYIPEMIKLAYLLGPFSFGLGS